MANETYLIVPIVIMALVGIVNVLIIVGNFSANSFSAVSTQTYVNSVSNSIGSVPIVGWLIAPIFTWFLSIMVANFTIGVTLGVVAILGSGIVFAILGLRLSGGGGILGTGVNGSIGLSDVSIMIIYKSFLFIGIWLFFSVLSLSAFNAFPLFMGWVIYLIISASYTIGVLGQIGHV